MFIFFTNLCLFCTDNARIIYRKVWYVYIMHSYTCIVFQAFNCVWQLSVKTTDIEKISFNTRKLPCMKGDNRNI